MSSEVKTQVVWLTDGFGGGGHAEVVLASDYAALEAEYERLREALEPFAALAHLFDDGVRGGTVPRTGTVLSWPRLGKDGELIENELTVEHLRDARAALAVSFAMEGV